ncbi:MAG TPA: alcohol dehydrogenase catalytic domain-containing protein [Thermoanaerobaculia bacterium]|nr:alcohol dehydrogenase catalytic domain-containing protein [Thermoanaerobaculia bacterium]
MRALWLEDRQLTLREDLPIPTPPPGEALVRVLMAGICNTDVELTHGYYPYAGIPGHEFVGVVEQGPEELRGERVVGEINATCGACESCRNARATHCENRNVLGIAGRNGAFAEWLILPAANLHVVPAHLSTERAVFTEPLAAALEIQEQIEIRESDRVLVVGDGKLGQFIARTLALTGCRLAVTGRHASKLALLESAGIATIEMDAIAPRTFDVAVECSGSASGFALARKALRSRGTLVMKSTYAGELTFNASAMVVDEITLLGSRCGPFAPALRLLAEGKVDPTDLIHARYPLRDAIAAFEHAQQPGILKVLVDCT